MYSLSVSSGVRFSFFGGRWLVVVLLPLSPPLVVVGSSILICLVSQKFLTVLGLFTGEIASNCFFNLNFKLHFIVRVVCVGVVLENQSNEFISFQLARLLPFIVIAFQLCFFLLFICFFHHRIPLYLVLKKAS